MKVSFVFLAAHLLCALFFVVCGRSWKIDRRWTFFFGLLFLFSPPMVGLIWGPFRPYGLYIMGFITLLLLAKGTPIFYAFLKTQEAIMRYLFWAAVGVLSVAMIWTSIFEIHLRRDVLSFWKYEASVSSTAKIFKDLADAYHDAKDPSEALKYYTKAVILNPTFIDAYEGMVSINKEAGQWAKVIALSKKVINIKPQFSKAYLDLGEAYRKLNQSTLAVETYSHLLDLFEDNEEIHVKVIEAYGQAIAHDPQNDLYKEKREEVLADLTQLSKRKNYTAMDYYNLAFLYEQVGGKEEAMRFYTKALEMKPDLRQALLNLGNLYRDIGNYKGAIQLYARLVHDYPQYALGYLNMGMIFNALGDQQRAKRLYLKVIDLDPDNGDAYFNLGYLSESQGQLNDAVNYYEKAAELAPKNAEVFYNLGNVYASLGQNGEAIAAYLKTVSLNPHHVDAFVNLSILSFKSHDFQAAIHYLEDARSLGYNPPAEYLRTLEPYRR